jgi:hypothetical protein
MEMPRVAYNGTAVEVVCVTGARPYRTARSGGQPSVTIPGTLAGKESRWQASMPCPDEQSETGAQFLPSRCARARPTEQSLLLYHH